MPGIVLSALSATNLSFISPIEEGIKSFYISVNTSEV